VHEYNMVYLLGWNKYVVGFFQLSAFLFLNSFSTKYFGGRKYKY